MMTPLGLLFVTLLQSSTPAPPVLPSKLPLLMSRVEACKLEWTYKDNGGGPRWGGSNVYDVKTDSDGAPVSIILRTDRVLPSLAKVDRFDSCVRNWRFGGSGDYVVILSGGSILADDGQNQWLVRITSGDRGFQFRFPLFIP
jgi:hypothetical protein